MTIARAPQAGCRPEHQEDRGIVSAADRRRRRVRWTLRLIEAAVLIFLLIAGLGPLLWMVKSSITPTQDTIRTPMSLWPNGFDLELFRDGLDADAH